MAVAAQLERFLTRKGVAFKEIPLTPVPNLDAAVIALGEPQDHFIRSTLLIDISGVLMVVHRFSSTLDIGALQEQTGRQFQVLTAQQSARLFSDCEAGFHPPLGEPYGVPVLVDEDVIGLSRAIMCCGPANSLIELDAKGLSRAFAGVTRGHLVIRGQSDMSREAMSLEEVADRLQRLYRLPPMPALALRILRLTTNSEATARELAELIEFDPSLTAQVMRYARSALFNYPGQINSVQEAVTRVLGFDRVAHIALGIASVKAFDVPREGMLGMDSFWRHSLYSAFLCQRMATTCGADKGLAYLCGLLHNFGLLLIGHLFPAEFAELNELREANPDVSMHSLEQQVFGSGDNDHMLAVGHGAIGGILHRLWQLPGAVVKAAGMHQHPDYHGEHETYVLMVQLANELPKEKGIGDEFNADHSDELAERLSLGERDINALQQEVEQVAAELDDLARSLAA